jgi:hypothetical protein
MKLGKLVVLAVPCLRVTGKPPPPEPAADSEAIDHSRCPKVRTYFFFTFIHRLLYLHIFTTSARRKVKLAAHAYAKQPAPRRRSYTL